MKESHSFSIWEPLITATAATTTGAPITAETAAHTTTANTHTTIARNRYSIMLACIIAYTFSNIFIDLRFFATAVSTVSFKPTGYISPPYTVSVLTSAPGHRRVSQRSRKGRISNFNEGNYKNYNVNDNITSDSYTADNRMTLNSIGNNGAAAILINSSPLPLEETIDNGSVKDMDDKDINSSEPVKLTAEGNDINNDHDIKYYYGPEISGGNIIVTGLGFDSEYSDIRLALAIVHKLNKWSPITVYVPDISKARKSITSRGARYSGLLGILKLKHFDTYAAIPMTDDVSTWLAIVRSVSAAIQCLKTALESGVQKLAIALYDSPEGRADDESLPSVLASIQQSSSKIHASLFVASTDNEVKRGEPYCLSELPLNDYKAVNDIRNTIHRQRVSEDEFLRCVVEGILLPETHSKAYGIWKGDAKAAKYLRNLRHEGFGRKEELRDILSGGMKRYIEKISKDMEASASTHRKPEGTVADSSLVDGAHNNGNNESAGTGVIASGLRDERDNSNNGKYEDERIRELFEKASKHKSLQDTQKLNEKAREILSREWRDKFAYEFYYGEDKEGGSSGTGGKTRCGNDGQRSSRPSESEYIEMHWERALEMARKQLADEVFI